MGNWLVRATGQKGELGSRTPNFLLLVAGEEEVGEGDDYDGADRGGGEAIQEAVCVAHNVELHEHPAADHAADESKYDVGNAAEAAAAGDLPGEPAGNQANQKPTEKRIAHADFERADLHKRGGHGISSREGSGTSLRHSRASGE